MTTSICKRKGCRRRVYNGKPFCQPGCAAVCSELAGAHHLIDNLGNSEVTDRYLEAAEALLRAWEDAQEAQWRVRQAGLEAGWTHRDITGLMRGEITAQRTG